MANGATDEGARVSVGETALAALFAALPVPPGGKKLRNASVPDDLPSGGLLVLRDGTRGQAVEEFLSPPRAVFRHAASLQILVEGSDDAARTAAIDALAGLVRAALAADRILGGAVDWCELQRGDGRDETEPGTRPIRVEEAQVILEYMEEM